MDYSDLLLFFTLKKLELSVEGEDRFGTLSNIFINKDYKKVRYYFSADNVRGYKCVWNYGFQTKLKNIKERLDLIGYSIREIEDMYEIERESYPGNVDDLLSFEEYYDEYINIDIEKSDTLKNIITNWDGAGPYADWDFNEYYARVIFESEIEYSTVKNSYSKKYGKVKKKGADNKIDNSTDSEDTTEFYAQIDPLIKLRILADNPENLDYKVTFCIPDFSGMCLRKKEEVLNGRNFEKILIATEGKTDAYILRNVLDQVFPKISDIFYFFDYSSDENLNISGCKELHKFCKHLSQLNHGKVIALFDNDGDGNVEYNKAKKINDSTLLVTKLPDLEEYKNYIENTPWSSEVIDLNGKAIAIESFLDIPSNCKIKWEKGQHFQGKLQSKKLYQEEFKKVAEEHKLRNSKYNTKKLEYLVKQLISEWKKFLN